MSDQELEFAGLRGFQPELQIEENQQQPIASTGINPEDVKNQLFLLIHCRKCQKRERDFQEKGENYLCALPNCSTIKDVLNHIATCQNDITCPFAHCSSSRQIIKHWEHCIHIDCIVCAPFRQDLDINEQQKEYQLYLVLILHATECQTQECNFPGCKAIKYVLNHLATCDITKNCKFSHCFFTRQIMDHWNSCSHDSCPMCSGVDNTK